MSTRFANGSVFVGFVDGDGTMQASRWVMEEVLVVYAATVTATNGATLAASACTRQRERGRWEVWFQFEPIGGGPVARTGVETTQPDREAVSCWALGISRVYLEGALARATDNDAAVEPARVLIATHEEHEPVLDPVEVVAGGEEHLRLRLEALSVAHLRDIARAQRIVSAAALAVSTKAELVAAIVAEARPVDSGRADYRIG